MQDPKKPAAPDESAPAAKLKPRDAKPGDSASETSPPSETIAGHDPRLPRALEGKLGNRIANVSWSSRMRWLDDGGR